MLNPMAKEYHPEAWKSTQKESKKLSIPPNKTLLKDVRPKQTEQWVQAASEHQLSQNEQQQVNTSGTSLHFQHQSTSTVQPTHDPYVSQGPPVMKITTYSNRL